MKNIIIFILFQEVLISRVVWLVMYLEQCIAGMLTQFTKANLLKERNTTNDILISLSATLPPVRGVGSDG